MILVAGGSGTLGSLLVRHLLDAGQKVRILTRDVARLDDGGEGAEVVVGDVRIPADVRRAVAGADVVVSAVQGLAGPGRVSPASIDRDGNIHLIEAAAEARADVVLVSVIGASPDSAMELFRMKAAAELHLRESSVAWTVVQSAAFLETWTAILEQTAGAVTDPTTRGRTIEVSGPVDLTLNELAAEVQRAAVCGEAGLDPGRGGPGCRGRGRGELVAGVAGQPGAPAPGSGGPGGAAGRAGGRSPAGHRGRVGRW